MFETVVTLAIISILLILWYQKRKKEMTFFERLNIPGPKPHFITGNLYEYYTEGITHCQLKWTKKYGNILGYYLGSKPILLVSDSDFWKMIQIKDFENFMDRDLFISDGGIPDKIGRNSLSFVNGTHWKNMRSILSPAFSTNKLKQNVPIIEDAVKVFLNFIHEKANNNEEFDIFPMFHVLTMDITGRTAFGIRTNIQKNPHDIFVKNIKYLSEDTVSSKTVWLIFCFQELEFIFTYFRHIMDKIKGIFGLPSAQLLFKNLNNVIINRKMNKIYRKDLLQIMLDANISSEELKNITSENLMASLESDKTTTTTTTNIKESTSKKHFLNNSEVMANCLLFMIGGYETTGTTLSFIIHLLVNYPEIQERVREEINAVLQNEELGYSAISKMQYLSQVISEALRLYPPVLTFTTRKVGKTFTYKNYKLPKDLAIQSALWQMQRNPDIWENSNKFDPDRFSPERKESIDSFAYQPFGNGPRNCIGMRFAYLVIKMALASLLHSFRFVPGNKTESDPPQLEIRLFQMNPLNGVYVKAIPL